MSLVPLAAIGAGIVTLGAAFAIGRLASSSVESIARQPEKAGDIRTTMIIAAALIEGFTFFALVVCQGAGTDGELIAANTAKEKSAVEIATQARDAKAISEKK